MATGKQTRAAKKNIKKAQEKWQSMEAKPTEAQKRARMENIEKAEAARWNGAVAHSIRRRG